MKQEAKTQDISILVVEDLMDILGIGRNSAYNLMKSPGFPSKKIGKLWKVSRKAFEEWLNKQD